MTAAKRIYELVKALPADKVSEILDFVEFLYQKQQLQSQVSASAAIPPGTLTRLSDIAKLSLAERHQILSQSIPATAHDFLTDPALTEFAVLDAEDWVEHD